MTAYDSDSIENDEDAILRQINEEYCLDDDFDEYGNNPQFSSPDSNPK